MVCQHCGQEASDDHAFCSACGAPLAGSTPPVYSGQSYPGQPGQPYPSEPNWGQPYPAQPSSSPPYPGQPSSSQPSSSQASSSPPYPGGSYQGPYQSYGQGYGPGYGPGYGGPPGPYPPYPGGSGQYPPPPGGPYGQPWQPAGYRSASNRYSTIGIVCGVLSFFLVPIIFGPAGLILSGIGRSKGESRANIGLVVSAVGLVCGVILSVVAFHAVYG
jgi:zinc-ribbon domain